MSSVNSSPLHNNISNPFKLSRNKSISFPKSVSSSSSFSINNNNNSISSSNSSNNNTNTNTNTKSKFKFFSKFSFTKQNPQQHKDQHTPNQQKSLLSTSIIKEKEKEKEKEKQKQKIKSPNSPSTPTSIPIIDPPLRSSLSTSTSPSSNDQLKPEVILEVEPSSSNEPSTNLSNNSKINELTLKIKNSSPELSNIPQTTQNSPIENILKSPKATLLLDTDSSILSQNTNNTNNTNNNNDDEISSLDTDSDNELTDNEKEKKLKCEESLNDYIPGGYHPTFIGELYGLNNEYLIVRKLGWGHFSTVWLSWDSINLRHVAIKIVKSSNNYTEAAIDEIKLLETVNLKNNNHEGKKHIVKLLDHFIHKGPNGNHVCMVFEVLGENMLNLLVRYKEFQNHRQKEINDIVNGKDNESNNESNNEINNNNDNEKLNMHISNIHDLHILSESYGGLPITLVKQISKQILLALDYLHRECGIIHTDIKPENVLVEIHDVEKLVQLLEFERKSKKLNKLLKKRHADHSNTLYHTTSLSINEIDKLDNFNTPSDDYADQSFRSFHSLSRSISANQSSIIRNLKDSSITSSTHIHQSSLSNSIIPSNKSRSRKNSIPVRSSKPLTSPVENSSVNNFFRSFSFSQKRNSSFSSPLQENINNNTTPSTPLNIPLPLHKSSDNNNNNNNNDNNNNISTTLPNTLPSQINNNNRQNSTLSISSYKQSKMFNVINEEDLNISIGTSGINTSSSSQTDDDQVFVDANEINNDNCNDNYNEPLHTLTPIPQHLKSHNKLNSIDSMKTLNDLPNNIKLDPFPEPNESRKPSLKIDTKSQNDELKDEESVDREPSTFSTSSQQSILEEFDEIISIKIADLGNACWFNKHYTEDIQTRQYRAPEIILGGDWGCSTDLWSTGCLIFELITSDYLFDPKSSTSYSRDDDHLAQIVELLKSWPPKEYLRTTSKWREFFDRSGQNFRKINKLKIWPLENVLIDEYKMNKELANEISNFLLPMLEFDPSKRIDAGSMCSHPWIKDISCGFNLKREYGKRGEDIRGYYEEY